MAARTIRRFELASNPGVQHDHQRANEFPTESGPGPDRLMVFKIGIEADLDNTPDC
jgi:hypothetical protein